MQELAGAGYRRLDSRADSRGDKIAIAGSVKSYTPGHIRLYRASVVTNSMDECSWS